LEIRPLSGYRYDTTKVGDVGRVVSPPYDQYDDGLQAAAYDQSPHHFVRLILPRDTDPHQAAAKTLEEWVHGGVLVRESAPAIYPYSQVYIEPRGGERVRHGFMALLKLTPLEGGPVYPHERTMPKTMAERLGLLRATKADLGPVFVTFADEEGAVSDLLANVHETEAAVSVSDRDGNAHHLWTQTDPMWHEQLSYLLRNADGVIADGHHRYKAALQYADELQAGHDHPARWKLVAFFPAFEDNVTVLPIHRVVENWPADAEPKKFFNINTMQFWRPEDVEHAVGHTAGTIGQYSQTTGTEVWAHKFGAPQVWDGEPSEIYRSLPAAAFEASVLRGLVGMTPEDIGAKKGLRFVRTVGEAKRLLWQGFDRAFFLPPTPVGDIIAAAKAGEVMPQKSTYFYPKVLSGLVSYLHDR